VHREFAAPYSQWSPDGRLLWHAGTSGEGYMTLQKGSDPSSGTLVSECNENCTSCKKRLASIDLTGGLGICANTPERAVYMTIAGYSFGTAQELCVDSLETYYEQLILKQWRYRAIVTATGSVLLVLVCIFCTISLCIRPKPLVPLKVISAEEIERRFPKHTGYDDNNQDETQAELGVPTCIVCLAPIEADDHFRRLQCQHAFHADCILEWWTHVPRAVLECPTCRRAQIVSEEQPKGGGVFSGSSGGGLRADVSAAPPHAEAASRDGRRISSDFSNGNPCDADLPPEDADLEASVGRPPPSISRGVGDSPRPVIFGIQRAPVV